MKIRHLASLAAVAVGALALTACSGGGPAASSGGASGGGDTLTVWHYFTDPQQVKLMDEYKTKFETDHQGAKVDNVFVPYDQLNSKLISSAGAGKGPDVVVFNGADAATLTLGGVLAPMDKYWDSFADKDKFPEGTTQVINGKLYAAQGYVNVLGLWYNKDILDKIGVQPPTTMDELEADMAKAKAAGFGGITLSGLPNSQGEWQAYPWLTEAGFSYQKPDASALHDGLNRIKKWVDNGWLPQQAATWDQTVPFQQFAAGKFAFAENGNWQQGTAKADAKFQYGVVPLPVGSEGKVYLGGEGEGIGAFSKNQDLAWEYLKDTYYDKDGELLAPKLVGSLPARTDAAQDSSVTSNALLKAFADTIAKSGATYPDGVVPPKAVADVQLAGGQAFSAVIGGQKSPADAANGAITSLKGLLG